MAYYPVKNGGTRTGVGYGSLQTGSFATLGSANYYGSLLSAISEGAGSGDIVQMSNLHSYDNVSSAMVYLGPTSGEPLLVVGVDDANMENYANDTGAKEETNSLIRFDGKIASIGVTYDTDSTIYVATTNSHAYFRNCLLNLTGAGDYIGCQGDGCLFNAVDCEINCSSADNGVRVLGGSTVELYYCQFTGTAINDLTTDEAGNGGGKVVCVGCDLSNMSATSYLMATHGATQNFDDHMEVIIHQCKLNANTTFVEETQTNPGSYILVTQSSSTSANNESEWQFYYEDYFGSCEAQPDNVATVGVTRNSGGNTFNSGVNTSYEIITNTNCNAGAPFTVNLPMKWAALSNASTDTARIHFASTTALTDSKIWFDMIYMDGTTKHQPSFVSGFSSDPLGGGNAYTDASGTEDWEVNNVDLNDGTWNQYYDDLVATSANDCAPFIRAYVAEQNLTVYVDSTIDLVA